MTHAPAVPLNDHLAALTRNTPNRGRTLESGVDLMTFEIGNTVSVKRPM